MGKFATQRNVRWCSGIQQRQRIDGFGQPRRLVAIGGIHAPNGVGNRFVAYFGFGYQRHFREVHNRAAQRKFFVERIFQMGADQCFALCVEQRLIFERHINRCPRSQNRLVENGYRSHRVIDRVIDIFRQCGTTGCNYHRSARHIHGAQLNLAARTRLIFTRQAKFIFLGQFAGYHQRRIVQLLKHIFIGYGIVTNGFAQMRTERFDHRKNDASG